MQAFRNGLTYTHWLLFFFLLLGLTNLLLCCPISSRIICLYGMGGLFLAIELGGFRGVVEETTATGGQTFIRNGTMPCYI